MPASSGLKAKIRDYKRTHEEFVAVYTVASALDVDPIDCLRAAREVADEDGRELKMVKPEGVSA